MTDPTRAFADVSAGSAGAGVRRLAAAAGQPVSTVPPADLLTALLTGECLAAAVPLVLKHVECDPLVSAGRFRGDLLRGLMTVRGTFWARYPTLYDRYRAVLRAAAAHRRHLPADQRGEFWSPLDSPLDRAAGAPRHASALPGAVARPHTQAGPDCA